MGEVGFLHGLALLRAARELLQSRYSIVVKVRHHRLQLPDLGRNTGDKRMNNLNFPIMSTRGTRPHPLNIPWSIAELAYSVYSLKYGRSQSLERMAERGGFYAGEMDEFLPNWRERASEVTALREEVARLGKEIEELMKVDYWQDRHNIVKKELIEAVQLLRAGKARFTPNTTNSTVDEFLQKHEALK